MIKESTPLISPKDEATVLTSSHSTAVSSPSSHNEPSLRIPPLRSYHSLAPIRTVGRLERQSSAPSLSPPHGVQSILPLSPNAIELRVVLHKELHEDQLLWLVVRRPYKEGFPRTIGHGSNIRISDSKLWVEGKIGRLLTLEKKWMIYQLELALQKVGHEMRIAVPRQWGQMGAMTTLSYLLGTPFFQDTLPSPADLRDGMLPEEYAKSTREELARALFASELHDVVLDLA